MGREPIHERQSRGESAVTRMTAMGATVVRISIPHLDELTRGLSLMSFEFKAAFDNYLSGLGAAAPVKSLAEFIARGEVHNQCSADWADLKVIDGPQSPEYQRMLERRGALRQAVMTAIAANQLDAILYPHQKRLVVPIGEDQAERNGVLSNSAGFPALTFPVDSRRRPPPRRLACRSASSCSDQSGASLFFLSSRLHTSRPRGTASRRAARRRLNEAPG